MNKVVAIRLATLDSASPVPPVDSILPLRLYEVNYGIGGKPLLSNISLTLHFGARTVVMGPNGAGKSLLLRVCHGLLQPTSGRVQWALDDSRRLRRRQAMVFQRPVLLRRSVAANVAYALAVQGISWRSRRQLTQRALEQVGLLELARRPARVLSGGEQQRLALARAWALRPQVLFMDEPTANLDPAATRRIEAIIDAIHHRGTKIVMTTHDLGQARRHADEVVFLNGGRVLEQTLAGHFFQKPKSHEARAFLAGELVD
jgi:tungstate transport system ATP-binding protein